MKKLLAVALLALFASACASITPTDTRPLLANATSLRAALHSEAEAVDTAYQTIADAADSICADTAQSITVTPLCEDWMSASAKRTAAARARTSLASAADEGMDQIVSYVQALHDMAEAGQQSAAASDSVNRRLGALAGLFGGAAGPLGFVTEGAFGQALKVIAQAQAASQVRRTLRDATSEAQFSIDLYALSMRNTLGACSVMPPEALTTRVRAQLEQLASRQDIPLSERASLSRVQDAAIAALNAMGSNTDPCRKANYTALVNDIGQVLVVTEQYRISSSFASIRDFRTNSRTITTTMSDLLSQMNTLGAFTEAGPSPEARAEVERLMRRYQQLRTIQETLTPYSDQADAVEAAERTASRFDDQRTAGAERVVRNLFSFAQAHLAFAETVEARRGLDLSRLLPGGTEDSGDN